MKYKVFLLILFTIVWFLITLKVSSADKSIDKLPEVFVKLNYCLEPTYTPPPKPTALDLYLDKLALCESGNRPDAVNPMDLDGTPSLGRYQFKQSTFDSFSALYGLSTTTKGHSIWNGDEQRIIVKRMAQDERVNFHWQFPACTTKLGLPPKVEG